MRKPRASFEPANFTLTIRGISVDAMYDLSRLKAFRTVSSTGIFEGLFPKFEIYLKREEGPAISMLGRFAEELATRTGSVVLCDPWRRGGQPIDLDTALDLIATALSRGLAATEV